MELIVIGKDLTTTLTSTPLTPPTLPTATAVMFSSFENCNHACTLLLIFNEWCSVSKNKNEPPYNIIPRHLWIWPLVAAAFWPHEHRAGG